GDARPSTAENTTPLRLHNRRRLKETIFGRIHRPLEYMPAFRRWHLLACHYGHLTGGAGPHQARRSGGHCRTRHSCPVWHFLPCPAAMLAAGEQSRTEMCPTGPVGLLVSKALF